MDIGCVGEIVLDDEDPVSSLLAEVVEICNPDRVHLIVIQDVAKWGIQRRAQFRKNTKLSTMTAEEQSGGVRISTLLRLAWIFFLIG